jgi:hypothetical protein
MHLAELELRREGHNGTEKKNGRGCAKTGKCGGQNGKGYG